jgi:hypothetical protein
MDDRYTLQSGIKTGKNSFSLELHICDEIKYMVIQSRKAPR